MKYGMVSCVVYGMLYGMCSVYGMVWCMGMYGMVYGIMYCMV